VIPGAIGAVFAAVGVLLGLDAAYGNLPAVTRWILAACAVWALLGGAVLGSFAVGVAFDRIPHDDQRAAGPGDDQRAAGPGDDEIDRMIRGYQRKERRRG
jgi:hypothetical protein